MRNPTVIDGIIAGGGIAMGKSYWSIWFSEFIISICGVQEFLWFSPKLANFLEIRDTDYWGDKRFKSFLLIYTSERARG